MPRIPAIVFILTICCSAGALATEPVADGRERLEAFLSELTSLTATFEQQLFDEYGELLETSIGDVAIAKPGRFRWEYREPYAQVIVTDGVTLWIYDVDLEQVSVNPMAADSPDSPAALLVGDIDLDGRYIVAESRAQDGVVWVSLTPRADNAQYRAVEIGFRERELHGMRLRDNLRQLTAITFADISRNAEVDQALFDFEPPAGIDVLTNSPVP